MRPALPVRPCDVRHYHHELHWVYRLDHVCPEPGREDTYAIGRRRISGERDRWDARHLAGQCMEPCEEHETVLARHSDVRDDDVWCPLFELLKPLRCRRGYSHLRARCTQYRADDLL